MRQQFLQKVLDESHEYVSSKQRKRKLYTGFAARVALANVYHRIGVASLRQISRRLSRAADVYTSGPCSYFVEQFVCTPLDNGRDRSEAIQESGKVIWRLFRKLEQVVLR